VYGGDGLAHAEGNTVFVPYVLPGEGVRAAFQTKKKKLIWTKLLEVTSPAAERIAAKCPHFQVCGGCHYQHIPAAEQARLKIEILRETLSGWAGFNGKGKLRHTRANRTDIATRASGRYAAECRGRLGTICRKAR